MRDMSSTCWVAILSAGLLWLGTAKYSYNPDAMTNIESNAVNNPENTKCTCWSSVVERSQTENRQKCELFTDKAWGTAITLASSKFIQQQEHF